MSGRIRGGELTNTRIWSFVLAGTLNQLIFVLTALFIPSYALPNRYRYGIRMTTVTVSEKYQVVIPKEVRESLGITPGQKIEVLVFEGRAEFIPVRDVRGMRGFVKGIDTSVPRDPDRV